MGGAVGSGLLEGKVFVVAGVGPLMGSATARVAAREGASVVLAARREEVVKETADVIREAGGSALGLKCDLGVEEDIEALVEATVAEFGRLDAVFYNAALFDQKHDGLDIDERVWDSLMDVNLMGPLVLARLAIPHMIRNGGGAFVFNSSSASLVAEDVRPGYGVTKAGLNALTRFVAGRYGREGIRANAILPFVAGGEAGAAGAKLNCLGRSGTAEEIGEVVVFLCSERASILTGALIPLDGGMLARAPWPSVTTPRVAPPAS